ncbi:hypothetical protein [Bradyrhizobium sp. BR 10289]|uniref:hypothetical protein n=1 Tax=Bradyrhizobium sp. BR 10289 TaxID=2749993 RepID=UPI001C64E5E6|nr:hypothetical protein [Bradyrhizobium sp. BR 10289]MBW7970190.1 hypothetical protein [Bradyrhizobium sp. BR 10289]
MDAKKRSVSMKISTFQITDEAVANDQDGAMVERKHVNVRSYLSFRPGKGAAIRLTVDPTTLFVPAYHDAN